MVKITCPVCHGTGRVPIKYSGLVDYYNPVTGDSFPHETCPACGGTGVQEISDEAYAKMLAEKGCFR